MLLVENNAKDGPLVCMTVTAMDWNWHLQNVLADHCPQNRNDACRCNLTFELALHT